MKGALEGIRVLDLSMVWAGPFAAKLLADMGAEVFKIEDRRHMDQRAPMIKPAGEVDPVTNAYGRDAYVILYSRNKYGITLDLSSAEGRELFLKLVKISDVVLENYSARVMGKLGLPYEVIREASPGIIMLSMPAFGMTGPERDYTAYGASLEALAGVVGITGYGPEEVHKSGINYGDPVGGLHAAGAILAALRYRSKTGKGQYIDLSQLESLSMMIGEAIMDYTMNGRVRRPTGNKHSSMSPHGCYRCEGKDRWVTIAVANDAEWASFCQAIGKPNLAEDERFGDIIARLRNQRELDAIVGEWTRRLEPRVAMETLQAAGVAAGAVYSIEDILNDPQLKARQFIVNVKHPDGQVHPIPNVPWKMSKTPTGIRMVAPSLGRDNSLAFKALLGLQDSDLEELEKKEVIGTEPIYTE